MTVAANVVMYVTSYCPYCTRAKTLLERKGASYQTIDVSDDAAKRTWLATTTGQRTVPQIFINDHPVGGFDDLYALDRQGKLDALLAAAPPAT